MRRIKLISFLVFATLLYFSGAISSVNAQSYSAAYNAATQSIEKSGIDLNDINASLEDAIDYAKIHYRDANNGNLGYDVTERDIAVKYYYGMADYLSNNGQKAITLADAVSVGFTKARSLVIKNHGEAEMNFLLGLVEQTVEDLQ